MAWIIIRNGSVPYFGKRGFYSVQKNARRFYTRQRLEKALKKATRLSESGLNVRAVRLVLRRSPLTELRKQIDTCASHIEAIVASLKELVKLVEGLPK